MAGIAGGVAAERLLMRRARRRPDPEAGERFAELPGERVPLTSWDGTDLHVRAVGLADAVRGGRPSGGARGAEPSPRLQGGSRGGGAPPTIVFVHGIGLNLTTWHYQWRAFSDRYRCVLYDARGHGHSARARGDDYSMAAIGRDLRAVLDATAPEGPVVVVGHSMGGMAIVALAEEHPDEFTGRIAGVVLTDTTVSDVVREFLGSWGARVELALRPLSRWYTSDRSRVERMRRRIRRRGTDLAFAIARATNFGPDASPAQVDYVARIAADAPPEVWSHALASLVEMDLRHAVSNVACPTLVVVGDADRLTPKTSAEAILRALPRGRGVVVRRAGHMAMMERHDAFNAVVGPFFEEAIAGGLGGVVRSGKRPSRPRPGSGPPKAKGPRAAR